MRLFYFAACALVLGVLPGCHAGSHGGGPRSSVIVVHDAGPPAHAPAHGYRRKHGSGARLVYNSRMGVYTVLGHRDMYFHDDNFYRYRGGSWSSCPNLSGPWTRRSHDSVPPGLHSKYKVKVKAEKQKATRSRKKG